MKPIRILTPQMVLLAEIDNYESLQFIRSKHDVGSFELRINQYKDHTDKLQKYNLIMLGADKHKVGIILHRSIPLDESGKSSEQWVIKGIELKGAVGQRITLPPAGKEFDELEANGETLIKHYIDNNVVNPLDPNRKIDLFTIAPNLNRGAFFLWQSRFKYVSDEVRDIALMSNLGWSATLDFSQRKAILDTYTGRDLTVSQTVNPPVIFSTDFDNIKSMEYTDSDLNYKNFAYVGGQGQGVERQIVEVGHATGLQRIESFFDARDVKEEDENGNPIPAEEVTEQLIASGEQQLKEVEQRHFLEAEIITNYQYHEFKKHQFVLSHYQISEQINTVKLYGPSFVYERDFDLGDTVTIQNKKWGVTMNAPITEIKEIWEPTGFRLEAVFGNNKPTLIRKIKQELSQIGREIRK
jgi:hypothetical protein